MLSFQAEFRIILDTKHIILHGTADESAGVCLRGVVFLKCQEPIKVKTVTLSFQGVAQVHWTEGTYIMEYIFDSYLFLIYQPKNPEYSSIKMNVSCLKRNGSF